MTLESAQHFVDGDRTMSRLSFKVFFLISLLDEQTMNESGWKQEKRNEKFSCLFDGLSNSHKVFTLSKTFFFVCETSKDTKESNSDCCVQLKRTKNYETSFTSNKSWENDLWRRNLDINERQSRVLPSR